MPASRSVVSVLLRGWETFLYTLKAGPAGGRQRHDGHRAPASSCTQRERWPHGREQAAPRRAIHPRNMQQ